jgi:DNA-binding NarL/FixJ family response regulator
VQRAIDRGASGYLSKALDGDQMVSALEAVHQGQIVVPAAAGEVEHAAEGEWPGRPQGLTAREAEVLALITQGLSNQEIADRSYLSINSVKTYIRTAYRKIGVTRRAQAVAWGMKHGFEPDRVRIIQSVSQE